ncbi:MFS transporter [Vibrio quintilis]|uniref:MFS transport protein AraJ n=1 Tax=Vibrio quintilis TaxID=1117707 RepID=A0A1M7YQ11_9VIBR|nr:MFS transporter [Vibrio quintilis]SHO54707.1 MFS transport protein AraJ [Vibrio quintilis]
MLNPLHLIKTKCHGAVCLCFMAQFLAALDALIIVPLSADIVLDAGVPAARAGYLTTAYSLAAAAAGLILNVSQDKRREKRRILLYLAGISVATLSLSLVNHFGLMLVMRMVAGFFGGGLTLVNLNYVLMLSTDQNKKQQTATVLSAFPLALAVGVPGLLFVAADHWRSGFVCLGLMLAGLLMCVWRGLPSSSATEKARKQRKECGKEREETLVTQAPPLNDGLLWLSVGVIFAAILSTFMVSTQYPVMLQVNFGVSEHLLSGCYILSGACSFLTVQLYGRVSAANFPAHRVIWLLSVLMMVATWAGFYASGPQIAASGFVIFVVVSASRTLILMTEVISTLPLRERMKMMGLQNLLQHLAVGIGGALGSLLIVTLAGQRLDFTGMLQVGLPFMLCSPLLWQLRSRMLCRSEEAVNRKEAS